MESQAMIPVVPLNNTDKSILNQLVYPRYLTWRWVGRQSVVSLTFKNHPYENRF